MEKCSLSYLPVFDADFMDAWYYIALKLKNPAAAEKLAADVEKAIIKRLRAPMSSQQYHSKKEREHPYYRITVRNFTVWYVVIGSVMEVRRFLYNKRDSEGFL